MTQFLSGDCNILSQSVNQQVSDRLKTRILVNISRYKKPVSDHFPEVPLGAWHFRKVIRNRLFISTNIASAFQY